MPVFIRRILETAVITVVSSFPMFIVIILNFFPANQFTYLSVFGISAVAFYILNVGVLRKHIMETESALKYFAVNIPIWLVITAVSFYALGHAQGYVYTAFFGFTKAINALGIGKEWSTAIFWFVYLLEIIYIPAEKKFVIKKAQEAEEEEE